MAGIGAEQTSTGLRLNFREAVLPGLPYLRCPSFESRHSLIEANPPDPLIE
jgi:hypothetical protein